MSVVIETTLGDITVDLFTKVRPRACLNFLKLCKMKYYNYNLFHTVNHGFIAQTGDPTGSRKGGESIYGVIEGPLKRYFEAETQPKIKHTAMGLISFVGIEKNMIGSQFFITLAPDLLYLDESHCVFGEVVEGMDVVELLNDTICDGNNRPYKDIRITHTVVLDDPFADPESLRMPDRSPSPSAERLQGGRIAPDEEIDETQGKSLQQIEEMKAEREAKARATILEMVGDIPDAEMAPPENVLFICKLNPVTTDDDLEIIFSRFGKINSCEVIRDKKTGDSLQYAFIEFDEKKSCEDAYFKMDNVLIDDRRIHVDFSQSVAKIRWHGKGRGITHFDDKGKKTNEVKDDFGKGKYKRNESKQNKSVKNEIKKKDRSRSRSPRRDNKKDQRDYYDRNHDRNRYRDREPRNNYPRGQYYNRNTYRNDSREYRDRYQSSRHQFHKSPFSRNEYRGQRYYDRDESKERRYKDDVKEHKQSGSKRDKKAESSEDESAKQHKTKRKCKKRHSTDDRKKSSHKKSKRSKSSSSSDSDSSDSEKHQKKKKDRKQTKSSSSSDSSN